ncbi:peptide deformylase [Candidatus Microgenomates bacterium]|nr:peptide deformylase [Candidatus Microgenomates bacterium]
MRPIVQAPNPVLRQPTETVSLSKDKLTKIVTEMKALLVSQTDPEGVGLAANQIGLPYSLFVARFDTKGNPPILTFVNPKMVAHSTDLQPDDDEKAPLEGCLSLPNYYGQVKRFRSVTLTFLDENLTPKKETFRDFAATVVQHEMDHLQGKIFVERILEQNGKLYKSVGKNKKGKDVWEEVEL